MLYVGTAKQLKARTILYLYISLLFWEANSKSKMNQILVNTEQLRIPFFEPQN